MGPVGFGGWLGIGVSSPHPGAFGGDFVLRAFISPHPCPLPKGERGLGGVGVLLRGKRGIFGVGAVRERARSYRGGCRVEFGVDDVFEIVEQLLRTTDAEGGDQYGALVG